MKKAVGIHSHSFFKLGKTAAKKDDRNLKFSALLKKLPATPSAWDFDANATKIQIPTPMFGNDQYGDCVMAGRAHQTLRFEAIEQKKLIGITDAEVLKEYWKEEGGKGPGFDKGLVVLDSLKLWRKNGWQAANKTYSIHAFAQIDQAKLTEIKLAIYLLTGAGCGLALPKSAQSQITAGSIWDVTPGPDNKPGSWGGHYVYLCGYNTTGPVCVTWARKQQMTWKFFVKYCDECYGIVDDKDRFLKNSPIDVNKMEEYLHQLN